MNQLFAAFIIIGIMLEMYQLNRARIVAMQAKKLLNIVTSVLSVAIIYALFMLAGWYATLLLPAELSLITSKIVAVTLIAIVAVYSFLRDKRYDRAGKMIYGSFNLFLLITVGRGIMHLLTGFVLSLLNVNGIWVLESYTLGIVLFGAGVILAKGDRVHIFGIGVGYIKIIAYIIAAALIIIN